MSNDARVIVFASQKGGSGKTTLSGHIAVAAEMAGAGPVAIVDTDPQGSLAKWWNARESATPVFVRTTPQTLARDIISLKASGIRLIVIDTPPAVTEAISDVVAFADLVVVPTRPSPHDLRAVGVTVDLVEAQGKPLLFVVNCATARARITSETAVSLSQHGTVAPVTLHNRVDYAASMIDGRTVGEIDAASRSAREVATLWSYIEERLRRLAPVEAAPHADMSRGFSMELLTPLTPSVTVAEEPAATAEPLRHHDEGWIGAAPDDDPFEDDDTLLDLRAALRRLEGVMDRPADAPQAAKPKWDGIDRRQRDSGPPTGVEDRRRFPVFGRRNAK